jgi:hypothetical protein
MSEVQQLGMMSESLAEIGKRRFCDLETPEKVAGILIATAGVNLGFKLERVDFDYLVNNLVRVVNGLYPNWLVNDVMEAIYLGSIGRYGEVYKLTLATFSGWLKKHEATISWRVLEAKIMESDTAEQERIRAIDTTLDRLRPLYLKEKIQGRKGWGSLILLQIPRLHQMLLKERPTLEELVFMIGEYGKKGEPIPPPEQFLATIRSHALIDKTVTTRIRDFIDELVKEADNDGSEN